MTEISSWAQKLVLSGYLVAMLHSITGGLIFVPQGVGDGSWAANISAWINTGHMTFSDPEFPIIQQM